MTNMNSLLHDLVEHARNHAPFFTELYRALPRHGWALADLPLIDPDAYWQQSQPLEKWPVLTSLPDEGHVFKTGGSSSEGKLSVFSRTEWQGFVRTFGHGLAQQLLPGDRVANLFLAGDLYTSLLFIHGALSHSPVPIVEFPFTCMVDDQVLVDAIMMHRINVLLGIPIQLVRFANQLKMSGQSLPNIRCLLYGGESLFPEQVTLLNKVFPNARIGSIGCASVDAGLIGAASPDCHHGEHRVFDRHTIVEIIDEVSGQPIDALDQPGMLVVTDLQRKLMPIIRYPCGDIACWHEAAGTPRRKFSLQGRANQGHRIRVCTLSLFPEEIGAVLHRQHSVLAWQLLIRRRADVDQLILHVASDQVNSLPIAQLRQALLTAQPAMATLCEQGRMELEIVYRAPEALLTHPRSGKLMRIVDQRAYNDDEITLQ